MIWLNPLAWLGLAVIALPILLHLIGRRRPVRVRFPTVRFLPASALSQARRRIEDVPLLLVRIAILTAAVAALAQPVFPTAARALVAARPARAIVIDASASMSRAGADGSTALAMARARARALATDARAAETIETGSLPAGIASALTWLDGQRGAREVVVLSEFHAGTLAGADVARVPLSIARRFERVAIAPPTGRVEAGARSTGDGIVDVTVEAHERSTLAIWRPRPGGPPAELPVAISLPAFPESERAAIVTAARGQGLPIGAPARKIEVDGTTLVGNDPQLFESMLEHRDRVDPAIDPASATDAVALITIAADAAVDTVDLRELEPNRIPDAVLREWTREPTGSPAAPGSSGTESDGRWLWTAALLLIAIEWPLRKRSRAARGAPVHETVDEEKRDARVA
jgi:hypothetical protein